MAASVVSVLAAPLPAAAQPPAGNGPPRLEDPDARAVQTEGEKHFNAGRYAEASAAFERAYALEPAAFLLFSRAQAERLAERCDVAVELFSAYIDTGPSQEAASMALERIHLCGGEYKSQSDSANGAEEEQADGSDVQDEGDEKIEGAAGQPPEGPKGAEGAEGPREGETRDIEPERRLPGRSWGLLAGGGIVLAVGAGLLAGGGATNQRARTVFGEADADSLGNTARGLTVGGAIALGVGTALLIAGIVDATRSKRRSQLAKGAR